MLLLRRRLRAAACSARKQEQQRERAGGMPGRVCCRCCSHVSQRTFAACLYQLLVQHPLRHRAAAGTAAAASARVTRTAQARGAASYFKCDVEVRPGMSEEWTRHESSQAGRRGGASRWPGTSRCPHVALAHPDPLGLSTGRAQAQQCAQSTACAGQRRARRHTAAPARVSVRSSMQLL